ncbi:MAG: hypothetical protein JO001_18835 [Alphaproteobacteria bacterium]|nr:hypothetical protein [Alphaproteobacteria bacterium]
MKLPPGVSNNAVLHHERDALLGLPGVLDIQTRPESGSIILHYDPAQEREFERHFDVFAQEHLSSNSADDEVSRVAQQLEASAEFLAQRSSVAKAILDGCRVLDRDLKLATGNTLDLKIVVATGLAAYTFLELGLEAGTPIWVTLAIFALNHFAEMHGEPPPAPDPG